MSSHCLSLLTKKICQKTLTPQATDQLQQLVHYIILNILNQSIENTKTITLTSELIEIIVKENFQGELCKNIVNEGKSYLNMSDKELGSNLTISLNYMRKYIRKNIPIKYIISYSYILYITVMMEYIIAEIIDLAYIQSIKLNTNQITHRCIFLAIHYDKELLLMYNSFNLQIIGAGLQPICPHSDSDINIVLPKKSIEYMVNTIMNNKLSKKSIGFLHHYIESFISNLLIKTDELCSHFDKNEIEIKDLNYIYTNY